LGRYGIGSIPAQMIQFHLCFNTFSMEDRCADRQLGKWADRQMGR
jgi:hypothetical protein